MRNAVECGVAENEQILWCSIQGEYNAGKHAAANFGYLA